MPPSPEIRYGHGRKGIIEIFRKPEAQHPSHPDGHIAVCAEIKIQLQRKRQRPQPCRCHGSASRFQCTDFFP